MLQKLFEILRDAKSGPWVSVAFTFSIVPHPMTDNFPNQNKSFQNQFAWLKGSRWTILPILILKIAKQISFCEDFLRKAETLFRGMGTTMEMKNVEEENFFEKNSFDILEWWSWRGWSSSWKKVSRKEVCYFSYYSCFVHDKCCIYFGTEFCKKNVTWNVRFMVHSNRNFVLHDLSSHQ